MRSLFALAACCVVVLLCVPAQTHARDVPDRPAPTSAPATVPLSELVERAWRLSREEDAKRSRRDEAAAREQATRSLFAGSPSVSLDLRRDLPSGVRLPGTDASTERGKNELEPGISAPLWLPGQRDAVRRTIDRERDALDARTRQLRWQLAGEVRDAVWRLAEARAEVAQQTARLDATRALEADVSRRASAGDLARSDLWSAQAETRAAEAAVTEATGRLDEARASLAGLTGVEDVEADPETPVEPIADSHPALQSAERTVATARARLEQAQATRRDNPTFSIVGRFDRDANGTPYRNTVRMGIAIPLDTEARNAPRIAAAGVELAEAEVAVDRERRRVAAEQRRASAAFEAARNALRQQEESARLAADAFGAIERAFRAGERSLPQLLQLRSIMLDAQLAREIARTRVGAALARLNQSNGVLP
jgi:outer membrane protein, heavy metal efflux system